jgi:hypothetical protein
VRHVVFDGAQHYRRLGVAQGRQEGRVVGWLGLAVDDEVETDSGRAGGVHGFDDIGQQLPVGRR